MFFGCSLRLDARGSKVEPHPFPPVSSFCLTSSPCPPSLGAVVAEGQDLQRVGWCGGAEVDVVALIMFSCRLLPPQVFGISSDGTGFSVELRQQRDTLC